MTGRADAATETTTTAWDGFVEANPLGSYLQLSGWAEVKAVNGWTSRRLHAADGDAPAVGAQVLLRRPGPLPWAFAYAPRGPVLERWDAARHRPVHGARPIGPRRAAPRRPAG